MTKGMTAAAVLLALLASDARGADQLGVGGGHSCFVQPGGKAYCWGKQEQGQVGDGSFDYSTGTPRLVAGAFDAVAVDGGYEHTCAAMSDGGVKCWGYDRWGQIGDGAASNAYAPRDVIGVQDAVDVGAGVYFSCALIDDGSVQCWGHGYHYQLGNGAADVQFDEAMTPAQDIEGATALAVGGEFACAVVDRKVKCWGRNLKGQLGRGTTHADPGTPVVADVSGIGDAIAIDAGYEHACVVHDGGAVSCWGGGGRGQLGNDDNKDSATPVSVIDLGGAATQLALGDQHSCALLEGGAVKCWGYNFEGSLGNGQAPADSFKPTTALNIGDVLMVASGGSHSCALTKRDPLEVWCWGKGVFGQIGNGQIGGTNNVGAPVRVTGVGFDTVFGGKAGAFETP